MLNTFKKTTLAIAAMTCLATSANAEIWINGIIFTTKADSTQVEVPFATITLSDATNHDEQKYFTVSNYEGLYEVKPYDYTKPHYMTVSAPGYETRQFTLNKLNPFCSDGRPFEGNRTVDVELKPIAGATAPVMTTYEGDALAKDAPNTAELILRTVPGIANEGTDWYMAETDGAVLLLINDAPVMPQLPALLDRIPANAITKIDYFDIKGDSIYEGVIRLWAPALGSVNLQPRTYIDYTLEGK